MPKLTYKDSTHQYFIGKKEVPSVSKLVEYACGTSYKDIPPEVLKMAGDYGTACHSAIEVYENTGEITQFQEENIQKYKELKEKYLLEVGNMEQMIHHKDLYAGRYDILGKDGVLWDIKTTSKPYIEKWEWQLSLYARCLPNYPGDKAFILYIPKKGKHKVIMIKLHSVEEVDCLVNLYYEDKNG